MSSSSSSPEDWVGKLVWVFVRNEVGLPISNKAECGVVIDAGLGQGGDNVWIVQVGNNYYEVWQEDMELMEEWDEELEREDGTVEDASES